jgi:hypothetical protein
MRRPVPRARAGSAAVSLDRMYFKRLLQKYER